jgi:hypothetical protein
MERTDFSEVEGIRRHFLEAEERKNNKFDRAANLNFEVAEFQPMVGGCLSHLGNCG